MTAIIPKIGKTKAEAEAETGRIRKWKPFTDLLDKKDRKMFDEMFSTFINSNIHNSIIGN
jgi:hypothetical protein